MKKFNFLILAIPFLFSSCADEEPSPEAKITGIYERITQGNLGWGSEQFDFLGTLEFKNDGTFTFEEVTKNIGGDEILGYRAYGQGTYTIENNKVTIVKNEAYVLGVEDSNYQPKSELILSQFDPPSFMIFGITEDYKILTSGCGPNELCLVLTYNRIE